MAGPSDILERVALVEAKATALHDRLDRTESGVKEQLKEIKQTLAEISAELKAVVGWMNRSLGWAAAGAMVASLMGGLVTALVTKFLK